MFDKFRDKNLAIICNAYPDKDNKIYGGIFIKSQLKVIKKYFNNVFVFCPVSFPLGLIRKEKIYKSYSYDNVSVIYVPFFYIPVSYFRRKVAKLEFNAIDNVIRNRNIKFDMIHSHFTFPCGDIGNKLAKKYDCKNILTIHEDQNWLKLEMKDDKNRDIWKSADFLIRVNKIDLPALQNYNSNIVHICNGFDEEIFNKKNKDLLKKKLNINSENKILVNVANLVISQKNQINLLKAIHKIVNVDKIKITLYLIGEGKDKNLIKQEINNLNLEKNVILVGKLNQQDISEYFGVADLFVLPSYSEGNPTVMFESLGCGIPFFGTKVGGVPEIITPEVGILCDNPQDVDELYTKLKVALNKEWDNNAILNYASNFTWTQISNQILKIYEGALDD